MADPVRPAISRLVLNATARGVLIFLGVVMLGQVSATAQRSTNAQDSDSEFLEFDNAFVPSPQQLIDHLNQLRGVQLQLGGEGRNGLPGDKEFQEWVTKELLPSLGEEQQQELKAIAERMMERRLGGSPMGAGIGEEGTGSDSQESPLSALREELRQNPELESSLREQLQRRPGNQPLSNLLQAPASEFEQGQGRAGGEQRQDRNGRSSQPGRTDRERAENGQAGDSREPTDGSNGSDGADRGGADHDGAANGGAERVGEMPLRGGASGNEDARRGTERGGSQRSQSGGPPQGGLQGVGQDADPQDNARSRPGTDSQSNAAQANRFPNRTAPDANEEGGRREPGPGNAENELSMRGSQNRDDVANPLRSEPTDRNSRPTRGTPGRGTLGRGSPGRGTSGQTPPSFNNDRNDGQLNQTSPPAREEKDAKNRTGDSQPKESFRDRMNRILLDAAKDSTSGDGGEGEPKEGMLDGFLNRVAARFQKTMRDPERQRHFRDRFEQERRTVSTSSLPSSDVLSRSGDLLSDSGGPGLLGMVLLIGAFTFVVVMFFSTPLRDRVFGVMNQYASNLNKTRKYHVPEIASAADLVTAVDQFVFWRFGLGAHWWHGGYVHQQLVEAHPHRVIEIDQLLDAYETARYSPTSDVLDEQRFAATARCLQRLKDEALTQAADAQRSDGTWMAGRDAASMIGGSPGPTR